MGWVIDPPLRPALIRAREQRRKMDFLQDPVREWIHAPADSLLEHLLQLVERGAPGGP